MVNCPNCDAAIELDEDELDEGDSVTCEECGADLSVASVDPLELESTDDDEDDEDEEEADEEDDPDYDEEEDEDDEEEDEEEDY